MKRQIIPVLAVLVLLCLLITGFMLPKAISDISDTRTIGHVNLVEAQPVSMGDNALSIVEKLALLRDENVASVVLEGGKYMDTAGAIDAAVKFAEQLLACGITWFDTENFELDTVEPFLAVDSASASSAIMWVVRLRDVNKGVLQVILDDVSGLMLGADVYNWGGAEEYETDGKYEVLERYESQLEVLPEFLAEYYDCGAEIMEVSYDESSFCAYLELSDGESAATVTALRYPSGFALS